MRLIAIVLVALSIPGSLLAQEKVARKEVDKLVEALASSNDRIKAYLELQKLGPPAYPHLFEHLSDERHFIRDDGGSAMRDWTVGQMCYHVIELQLQPYKTFTEGDFDPRQLTTYPRYRPTTNFELCKRFGIGYPKTLERDFPWRNRLNLIVDGSNTSPIHPALWRRPNLGNAFGLHAVNERETHR